MSFKETHLLIGLNMYTTWLQYLRCWTWSLVMVKLLPPNKETLWAQGTSTRSEYSQTTVGSVSQYQACLWWLSDLLCMHFMHFKVIKPQTASLLLLFVFLVDFTHLNIFQLHTHTCKHTHSLSLSLFFFAKFVLLLSVCNLYQGQVARQAFVP